MSLQIAMNVIGKSRGGDRRGGNLKIVLELAAMFGDRRGAAVSTADAEDDGVALAFNLFP